MGMSVASDQKLLVLTTYSALIVAELFIPCVIRDPGQHSVASTLFLMLERELFGTGHPGYLLKNTLLFFISK